MFGKLKRKLRSQAGESIGETLAALLIAAFALVMLAGAVSASSNLIQKGKTQLDHYYSANEERAGVVKMESGGVSVAGGIVIEDASDVIADGSCNITYYKNQFGGKPIVAYKSSD